MNTERHTIEGNGNARGPRFSPRMLLLGVVLLAAGALLGVIATRMTAPRTTAPAASAAAGEAKLYQCPMHPTITSDHPSNCPICGMKLVEVKGAAKPAAEHALYQCPMHPTVTSDHPSNCPICGMKLVEVKGQANSAADTGRAERKILFYRSPMNPEQTSHTPRKDEMGMDYVPVYEDEITGAGPAKIVDGLATVTIDPARQQLIGLRTAPVTRGPVSGSWRTTGRIEVDPTRVRRTNVKVDGFVEKLFVDFVGLPVRKGQPLFTIYSPAVLAAENEYLLALNTRDQLGAAGPGGDDGAALVASARRKLELWDVPAAEIARLERTRQASRTVTVLSPVNGVVTAKNVVEGATLRAGDTPYEITDLAMVWVMADAYEGDVASVKMGMPASLQLSAYPGRTFRGSVAFIDPVLDPATRTVKVHMHFGNPGQQLKPGMFGDVVLAGRGREGLRIPADAVIRAGVRDVVFVALGEGKFAPREVQLGAQDGGDVEVRGGLAAGEQVVTRANFLIDSESQLRASLASLSEKKP